MLQEVRFILWQHPWLKDPYAVFILARRGRCCLVFPFFNSLVFELFPPPPHRTAAGLPGSPGGERHG